MPLFAVRRNASRQHERLHRSLSVRQPRTHLIGGRLQLVLEPQRRTCCGILMQLTASRRDVTLFTMRQMKPFGFTNTPHSTTRAGSVALVPRMTRPLLLHRKNDRTIRCNRAAKSGVLKWLIFRRCRLIGNVPQLNRLLPGFGNHEEHEGWTLFEYRRMGPHPQLTC
ncbi:hypothetical protein Enr13x_10800 [Stieleria neptunia]|uniref:Uncharacterized protein n=1 Tax=Stieleria neptunia TaxID=2527979 RepID=A0A518HK54_9BACT|nr:hypothetical protein Enr13x_10800 [Stieleria neptunia]